ncbi:MAG TPA: magnesium transporter CorA family protein [Nitrososphaeraceae archaeon]|nr:magnesium transporter CorA family protein [Nitrososphaeraceae archaeon]
MNKNDLIKDSNIQTITNKDLVWVNITQPTRNKIIALAQKYPFHELNLDDCLSKIQIPKIDKYHDHMFIILHFPTSIKKEENVPRFSQLSIFIGLNYLVTVHEGDLKPLVEKFQICNSQERQREIFMNESSGHLLYNIIDILVDDLFNTLLKVMEDLHDIEDDVFNPKLAIAKEISYIRREITVLRRIIIPLRRIIIYMTNDVQKFSEQDLILYFDDVKDHIDKVLEVLEESKETIEIYKDTDYMLSTEKTNKILGVLTILFTLSIPSTIIGTLYGMNINLPGGIKPDSLYLFGPYTTFILLLIISLVSALLMAWYFHRLGWIRIK